MAVQILAGAGRAVGGLFGRGRLAGASRVSAGDAAQTAVSSVSINLTSNLTTVQKAIDAFGRNQLPFATAMALNDTAFEVRKDTIERVWPKSVTVRKSNFMSAMLMPIRGDNRATKRKLVATVQNYPTGKRKKDYLQRLAVGGTKTVIDGRNITIPAVNSNLRNAQGAVPKSRRATALLNRKGVFRNKLPNGQEFIARRVGRDRYPLQMLYLLEPSGKIKKEFNFYEEANSTARKSMQRNFAKRFAQAKRSARRR